MTKNVLKAIVAMFSISLITTAVAEEMFKWKDDKGITHYTQTPPQNREFEVIEMTTTTSRGGNSDYTTSTPKTADKPRPTTAPNTELERYNEVRKNNCKLAKRNLDTLTTVARIRIADGSGGERLLTDKEKAEKIALTQKQVKNFCSKENNPAKSSQTLTDN